uniref:H+-transporting two-sector ATPase, alpha/beta subunit, central region, related n=1 Tax=Medicago truncatula TaxID=3880 RepID=A2Q3P1_MEDTR|nr:H+-transporting two-sector ATPase, alpha/beta subunit, central region, related [Medicago truncatula]
MLMRQEIQIYDEVSAGIWHSSVRLKVSICVWRLLCNRWSTKDNLFRRSIITNESQLRVSECGHNESADHLIIHCPVFGTL